MLKSESEDLLSKFEEAMNTNIKNSKIKLIVPNLSDKNFELIKRLINFLYVEGIVIKKR